MLACTITSTVAVANTSSIYVKELNSIHNVFISNAKVGEVTELVLQDCNGTRYSNGINSKNLNTNMIFEPLKHHKKWESQ